MENKEKSYNIKIPVYISEKVEEEDGFFGILSYQNMIDILSKKIDAYNDNPTNITNDKRNKTVIKEIEKVTYSVVDIGDEKGMLLKITASNTNFFDGYLKTNELNEEKRKLNKTDKVGSDNNYILLYPKITGANTANYKYEWIILIYEDPNKENSDIVGIAKLVMQKILNISIANLKLPELLSKLEAISIIPELQLKFSTVEYDTNDVDEYLVEYLTKSKIVKQQESFFKNVPFEKVKKIINEVKFYLDYKKKSIKIVNGKNEIKIFQEHLEEAKEKLKITVEEIFNQNSLIYQSDIEKKLIYDETYIIEKLSPILANYLISNAK